MLKITAYAQRLIDDLSDLSIISERVKTSAEKLDRPLRPAPRSNFDTTGGDKLTRLYHPPRYPLTALPTWSCRRSIRYIEKWADRITNMDAVRRVSGRGSAKKSDFERTEVAKDKTGVRLEGVEAINPVNRHQTFRSLFPTMFSFRYGTGAIMAVPGTRYP